MNKFYPKVLNKNQLKVFKKLSFLKKRDFYLAGGTSLAIQIGHRTSLDFDFYSAKHFDSQELFAEIESIFEDKATLTGKEKDTLFCVIDGVQCSFFWYKYPLLKKAQDFMNVQIASLEDIAAMKLAAVSRRPAKRDYIDVYFLLDKFGFKEMFSFASKKYPSFNTYFTIRALTYFEDLKDEERRKIEILSKSFSWKKAKEKIFEEVKKYQLGMFKK